MSDDVQIVLVNLVVFAMLVLSVWLFLHDSNEVDIND